MKICPACKQPITNNLMGSDNLLRALKAEPSKRQVYITNDGRWFLSHGGGQADPAAVRKLAAQGAIQPVYSTLPNSSYHVGRTFDVERTLAARKERGNAAPNYFLDDPPC